MNYEYKLQLVTARSTKSYDTDIANYREYSIKQLHVTACNPHIQMACDIGELIL